MKRYKIKNLVNGMQFQIETEAEQLAMQPEWGKPEAVDADGNPIPAEHEIIIEDMTAELDAKAQAEAAKLARKLKLKTDLVKIKDKDNQDYMRLLIEELGLL